MNAKKGTALSLLFIRSKISCFLRGVEVLSKERKKAESPEMRTRRVALKGRKEEVQNVKIQSDRCPYILVVSEALYQVLCVINNVT